VKITKKKVVVLGVIVVLGLCACLGIVLGTPGAETAAVPTSTSVPTSTAMPTSTAVPASTAAPTEVPPTKVVEEEVKQYNLDVLPDNPTDQDICMHDAYWDWRTSDEGVADLDGCVDRLVEAGKTKVLDMCNDNNRRFAWIAALEKCKE